MFMNNARLFWTFKNKMEPDTVKFIKDYPDEDPVNFVYQLSKDDIKSYVIIQITQKGLITREITEQSELDFIEEKNATSS